MNLKELIETVRNHEEKITFISNGSEAIDERDFIYIELNEDDEPMELPIGYKEFMDNSHIINVLNGLRNLENRSFDDIQRFKTYIKDGA